MTEVWFRRLSVWITHNQKRDVDLHESRDFSLCGGDGVDDRGRSGLYRIIFLVCGRG